MADMQARVLELLRGRIKMGGAKKTSKRKAPKSLGCQAWIDFVKDYAVKHKISYKDALKKAAPEWKKMKTGGVEARGVRAGAKRKHKMLPKHTLKKIVISPNLKKRLNDLINGGCMCEEYEVEVKGGQTKEALSNLLDRLQSRVQKAAPKGMQEEIERLMQGQPEPAKKRKARAKKVPKKAPKKAPKSLGCEAWINFVKDYAMKHGIKYNDALKKAAPEWRKYKASL